MPFQAFCIDKCHNPFQGRTGIGRGTHRSKLGYGGSTGPWNEACKPLMQLFRAFVRIEA